MPKNPPHVWAVDNRPRVSSRSHRLPGWCSARREPVRIPRIRRARAGCRGRSGATRDEFRDRHAAAPRTSRCSSRSPRAASIATAARRSGVCPRSHPGLLDHQPGRPPGRGLLQPPAGSVSFEPGLQARAGRADRDRWRRGRPDRRGRPAAPMMGAHIEASRWISSSTRARRIRTAWDCHAIQPPVGAIRLLAWRAARPWPPTSPAAS